MACLLYKRAKRIGLGQFCPLAQIDVILCFLGETFNIALRAEQNSVTRIHSDKISRFPVFVNSDDKMQQFGFAPNSRAWSFWAVFHFGGCFLLQKCVEVFAVWKTFWAVWGRSIARTFGFFIFIATCSMKQKFVPPDLEFGHYYFNFSPNL